MKYSFTRINLIVLFAFIYYNNCYCQTTNIVPPSLTNNPSFDVICTNNQPLLTFYNAKGGVGELKYTIQISTDRDFEDNYLEYSNVATQNKYITTKLIEDDDKLLVDKQYYYWRVKAVDSNGNESSCKFKRYSHR